MERMVEGMKIGSRWWWYDEAKMHLEQVNESIPIDSNEGVSGI